LLGFGLLFGTVIPFENNNLMTLGMKKARCADPGAAKPHDQAACHCPTPVPKGKWAILESNQ